MMTKKWLAWALALCFLLPCCGAAGAEGQDYFFSNMNSNAVQNGVQKLRRMTLETNDAPILVEKISTYHWNSGKGTSEPGSISIVECVKTDGKWAIGATCGTWQATGESANGVLNAYWVVYPSFTMEPGHSYAVLDSDTNTWSQNPDSEGYGMCEIVGTYLTFSTVSQGTVSVSSRTGSEPAGTWTCPNCGKEGNTGKFCPECASPALETSESGEWTCPNCHQEGNTGKFCSNCATPRPGASVSGQTAQSGQNVQTGQTTGQTQQTAQVNSHLQQIRGETDRVKVCLQGVNASAFIANKADPSKWIPQNAIDDDESTCWQYTAKKGAWLEMNLEAPETVDEIWFKNGFWAVNDKGKDQYVLNARLKAIKVQVRYSGESKFRDVGELTLKDESRNGWQRFTLGRLEDVEAVKIIINSTYKGSAFPKDVCLSEVMLVQQADAAIAKPAAAEKTATVYESRPDVTGCNLLMKLATRSGPATEYDEPGTFFPDTWQTETVRVLKKHYDGSIWWVQVDFNNHGKASYRVWTGVKRVNVDLKQVKEEYPLGDCDLMPTSETYWGPGTNYARANISVSEYIVAMVYQIENGFADVEFPGNGNRMHRCWVPERYVLDLDTSTDRSGE